VAGYRRIGNPTVHPVSELTPSISLELAAKCETVAVDGLRARIETVIKAHYLAGIECSHERGMDLPMCACSQVDLGWHPNVGEAVDAYVKHVMEVLDAG
jgi:hypothetical protein